MIGILPYFIIAGSIVGTTAVTQLLCSMFPANIDATEDN